MTATTHLTVPHSINPIFQYIFDCLGFNPMNGNFDFVFLGLNRLWMVSVTLILNVYPQKIVQRGQITAPRRPIDIRISADYSIFENGASNGHEAPVLGLFELCRPSYRGLYAKFSSEKYEECSVPENDGELMLMDVEAHSGQQQQCFQLSALDENVNGLFCPITIHFHELASQIDPQTAMKALLFCQIFFLNFLQCPNIKLIFCQFVNVIIPFELKITSS